MSRLSDLKKEKRRIENEIKEIESGAICNSNKTAKIWSTENARLGRTEWRVTVMRADVNIDDKHSGSGCVVSALTKEDAINEIPNVIRRLEDLYRTAKEKENE